MTSASESLNSLVSRLSESLPQPPDGLLQNWREQIQAPQLPSPQGLQENLRFAKDSGLESLSGTIDRIDLPNKLEAGKEQISTGVERFGQWDDAIAAATQGILSVPAQDWLQSHRLLLWALQHPLIALVVFLVVLTLVLQVVKLLLSPRTWLAVLGFPVRLIVSWVTPKPKAQKGKVQKGKVTKQLPPGPDLKGSFTGGALTDVAAQEQLQTILSRLKTLQEEQQQLQQQLEDLLKTPTKVS